jgi:hypothetical protein
MARPIKITVLVTHQTFKCFESRVAVQAWLEARGNTKPCEAKDSPCADCSVEYRDAMTLAGRCAHPETVFIDGAGINQLDSRWRDMVRGGGLCIE